MNKLQKLLLATMAAGSLASLSSGELKEDIHPIVEQADESAENNHPAEVYLDNENYNAFLSNTYVMDGLFDSVLGEENETIKSLLVFNQEEASFVIYNYIFDENNELIKTSEMKGDFEALFYLDITEGEDLQHRVSLDLNINYKDGNLALDGNVLTNFVLTNDDGQLIYKADFGNFKIKGDSNIATISNEEANEIIEGLKVSYNEEEDGLEL